MCSWLLHTSLTMAFSGMLILNEVLQMLAVGTRFQLCLYMPAFDDTDLILNAALWKDKLHCCCFLYKKQEAAFHDVGVNCS